MPSPPFRITQSWFHAKTGRATGARRFIQDFVVSFLNWTGVDAVEAEALLRARELGASLEDIADALAITRQGVAYKLKTLAGNGDAQDEADERDVVEVAEDADVAEVGEFVEVPDEPQLVDEAEAADEAEDEVIDVRAPQTEHRGPEVDFRRPHTKS